MSLLTVDQIQYNGGTALTLPTATPSAGDMLQTNGSGVLSWRDRLQKVTNAAGTVTYTTPANIQAGKSLGTAGGNTLGWYSGGGDPMAINSHIGWRLGDKIDFNATINAYGGTQTVSPSRTSSAYLKIPSSINASDVISYHILGTGLGSTGTNWSVRFKPINASNTNILQYWGNLTQTASSGQNAGYNTSQNNYADPMATRPIDYQQFDSTYGDWNRNASASYATNRRRYNFEAFAYNSKYDMDLEIESQWFRTNSDAQNVSGQGVYAGRGNVGNQAVTTDFAAGFQIYVTSGNFGCGSIELYYCLRDGV